MKIKIKFYKEMAIPVLYVDVWGREAAHTNS